MLATSLTSRLGVALATGAIAMTGFAGVAGAASYQSGATGYSLQQHSYSYNSNSNNNDTTNASDLADAVALCKYVDDNNLDEEDFNGFDIDEYCDQVDDYADSMNDNNGNATNDCAYNNGGNGSAGSFTLNDWMSRFHGNGMNQWMPSFGSFGSNGSGYGSANVNADANTTVNNQINAGSQNNVSVTGAGMGGSSVDATANTTVTNEINAASENNVDVNQ